MHRKDVGLPLFKKETRQKINWPQPEKLMKELLNIYRRTHRGFNPDHRRKTDREVWNDAIKSPFHLAISLTGEPFFYPHMDKLVKLAKERNMTTFIVTNGTLPKKIANMDTLPTQLYVTLAGPDYDTWAQVTNPLWDARGQWEKLNESLALFPSLNTRTVVRITAVKDLNMRKVGKYAELLEKAEPNFISVKGFSHVGGARKRLDKENQPQMEDVESFADTLAKKVSYKIAEKVERGRAVLLWNEQGERMIKERTYEDVRR